MTHGFTYSFAHRAAHWLTAAIMAAAFALVWIREVVEDTALRTDLITWHRAAGLAVLGLALWRLALRAKDGAAPPLPGQPRLQALAASLVHGGLYVLMLIQPLLGWAYISAKGKSFDIGPLHLPALLSKSPQLAELTGELHEGVGAVLATAIALHLAATAYHALWRREPILARMLPAARTTAPHGPILSGEQQP
ncbi:MAG TPA: cytochrome b/b6 domain-containing protein [Magnetospirillum sp.]|nr:cytochrome b/b6 domain-containing protein [Magnetospirillum sp.]